MKMIFCLSSYNNTGFLYTKRWSVRCKNCKTSHGELLHLLRSNFGPPGLVKAVELEVLVTTITVHSFST